MSKKPIDYHVDEHYPLIKEDLIRTTDRLRKLKFIYLGVLPEEQLCKPTEISSKKNRGFDKNQPYVYKYVKKCENKEFLYLLNEKDIVQCYYKFKDENVGGKKHRVLDSASLVYIPCPHPDVHDLREDLSAGDIAFQEEIYSDIIEDSYQDDFEYSSNYMRLDYTTAGYKNIKHSKCHLHIGLNNDFRLSVDTLPLVSEFIELILYLFYQEEWEKFIKQPHSHSAEYENIIDKRKKGGLSIDNLLTEQELLYTHLKL